jgi:hypothetical protein
MSKVVSWPCDDTAAEAHREGHEQPGRNPVQGTVSPGRAHGISDERRKRIDVVYEKDGVEEILTFQDRKGMAKPYQVKQMLSVIEKYRMGE